MLFIKYLHVIEVWLVDGKPTKFKKNWLAKNLKKKVIFKKRHGYLQATIHDLLFMRAAPVTNTKCDIYIFPSNVIQI